MEWIPLILLGPPLLLAALVLPFWWSELRAPLCCARA